MISPSFCRTTNGLIIFLVVDDGNDVVVVAGSAVKMLIAFSALGQC
jgi:hypothetical protein